MNFVDKNKLTLDNYGIPFKGNVKIFTLLKVWVIKSKPVRK